MSKSALLLMEGMTRRDIYLHKKLKDQQVLQLHTRLHYLDQENKKKRRQIEEKRKQAELTFENQIQTKHLSLQKRLQGCAEKIRKSIKVKHVHDETIRRKQLLSQSYLNNKNYSAKKVRREKEKIDDIRNQMMTQDMLEQKIRAESQHKETIIKTHLRSNQSGKIDLQIQAMESKKKKKLDDIEQLKTRDCQIKQLALAEKLLLDKLHHTIQNEDRVLSKLNTQKAKQN